MTEPHRHKKREILLGTAIALIVVLACARAVLPIYVKNYVNRQIEELEGYSGQVSDIDLYLWRGAYTIKGMDIIKTGGGLDKPFIKADSIDLSVQWAALFKGAIVAEIDAYDAQLNFAKNQTGSGGGWLSFVDALSPLEINRVDIHSGRISYTDYVAEPNIHLFIEDIDANVTNIRAVKDEAVSLPSDIDVKGKSVGGGDIIMQGRMNALKDIPDFDLSLELNNTEMKAFNDYTNEFAAIDVKSGNLGIFSELAAVNGAVTGYVKLVTKDLNIVDIEQDANPFNLLWESIASTFIEVFQNYPRDQFALKIPLEGSFEEPETDMWQGFLSIFQNAFVKAFTRDADGTVDFENAIEEYGVSQ